MRWALTVFVVMMSVLLGSAKAARAAVVRDGQTMTIDLSEARICFVSPTTLWTEDDCVGLPSNIHPPSDNKVTHLAAGIVRAPGSRTSSRIFGLVHAYRVDIPFARELTNENVNELADQIIKSTPALPNGVTRRPPVARLEKVGGLSIARITLVMDGLPPPSDDGPPDGHIEMIAIPTIDANYVVEFTGTPQNAAAIAHLVDTAAPTIHLDPIKMPRIEVSPTTIFGLSPMTVGIAISAVIFLMIVVVVMSRSRRDRAGGKRRRLVSFHADLWPPHDP